MDKWQYDIYVTNGTVLYGITQYSQLCYDQDTVLYDIVL